MADPTESVLLLVIITLILPPVGVFMISDCGPDLLVNIVLTLLGFIPGHVHAFYLEYIYYDRRQQPRTGTRTGQQAPGIFSGRIQNGRPLSYDTMATGAAPTTNETAPMTEKTVIS